jgi:hypothetical protein
MIRQGQTYVLNITKIVGIIIIFFSVLLLLGLSYQANYKETEKQLNHKKGLNPLGAR